MRLSNPAPLTVGLTLISILTPASIFAASQPTMDGLKRMAAQNPSKLAQAYDGGRSLGDATMLQVKSYPVAATSTLAPSAPNAKLSATAVPKLTTPRTDNESAFSKIIKNPLAWVVAATLLGAGIGFFAAVTMSGAVIGGIAGLVFGAAAALVYTLLTA